MKPNFKDLLLGLMFIIQESWTENEIPVEIRDEVRKIKLKLGVTRIDSEDEVWHD